MQAASISHLAALPSPLPDAPEGEIFTPTQWTTLFSILEIFLPSLSASQPGLAKSELDDALTKLRPYIPDDASDDQLARTYLAENPTADEKYRDAVVRKFKLYVPPTDAQGLGFILSALNTTVGCYLLTGYTAPLHSLDLKTRTRIVCGWSEARLPPLRAVYRSMSGLARQTYLARPSELHKMIDFPETPKHIDRTTETFGFKFHDFTSPETSTTLSTDVIIVGSGCGAGVVASHLSRAGIKCLVLEKSYHFPATHFPMSSSDSGEHLLENGGMILSDDASVGILAGSTFGGGGTINWSASLQPPHAVREDWASDNLPHFLGAEYQDCLDTICSRMGVAKSTDTDALGTIEHNFANATLLEGARRLGMAVQIVPQNAGGKKHYCGYCTNGCAGVTKQGPANCWFPDAAANGAEFVEGCWVEEVLFSEEKNGGGGKKRATGVKALWTSRDRSITRKLTLNAKRVIICSGTLGSPLVLLRSGLKNPHIGANLYLHPTNTVWATWPHRVNPWEGAILTVAMTGLEDLDGKHHGAKAEVICSTPGLGLLTVPFRPRGTLYPSTTTTTGSKGQKGEKGPKSVFASAIEYRLSAAKHGYSTGFVIIARDADTGRIYIDPKDPTRKRARVAYTPSARDRAHILEGSIAGLHVAYTMGAVELECGNPGVERWVRPSSVGREGVGKIEGGESVAAGEDDERDAHSFDEWISLVRNAGFTTPDPCTAGSAHQMGTCRMGSSPATGVVDSKGKVFGTEGLYVADASVFPSASGVNPMVGTMGVAEWICRGAVREVRGEREER